ncbi:ubiquitin carboxyl-terminal hydrolase family protein [Cardinium endosymbiont of Oedothorax gibbosus]|uniref:ubiquitin carboxyl-terminal hydrolase family protein n=1 Tax=Cardinium endosymbiont of Oedothorax gibbosus TaxID=931101 RepID=UPI0020241C83|nr:ubiquitin carboxyl-terminal hydrolase family protein [Cardinium endosymbiont of Oedothorax gibbosus]CAH2560198.1 Papain-like cysteine peptidase superfamily protein [Cardinium endosymbiont of Oedothorax gibbosus]
MSILIVTYTTTSSCTPKKARPFSKSSTATTAPAASSTDSIQPDLNGSTGSLNSDSSSVSSGNASPGVSSGSASSDVSSGSASSALSPPPAPTAFAGLPNIMGKTCYMNAVLQIIAALYADKVQTPLKDIITKINTTHQPLKEEDIMLFIRSLPEEKAKKMAISGRQQDAEEFISPLNSLYKFLDPITIIPCDYILTKLNAKNCISASPLYHNKRTVSFLTILFRKEHSLSEMINRCSITASMSDCDCAERDIYKLPDRLFIKLNRVTESGSKIICEVNDTMHITIQSDFSKQSTNAFDLNGFIVHQGNESGGHYIAYVKREGKWYEANDLSVTEIREPEVRQQSQQAYLLFYTKVK